MILTVLQLAGAAAILAGVYLLLGLPWVLLLGGALIAGIATLAEARRHAPPPAPRRIRQED